MPPDSAVDDFIRLRLDVMIDLRTPLSVLAFRMPWQQFEASVALLFVRKAKAGKRMPDLNWFGQGVQAAPKRSNSGRPRVPLRTMMVLLYLKHTFNESDEGVVARCAETSAWHYFCGHVHFEQRQPCDVTTLVKFRKMLGDEGMEELLAQTVSAAVDMKLIAPAALASVIVDSTVQHKAIAHPTDSRLLETAKDAEIDLKQAYAQEGTHLGYKAGRYAHACQFKHMRKVIGRQRTALGRLMRDM
jgi:IS5 family transposase